MSPRFDDPDDLPLRSRHAAEDEYGMPSSRRQMSTDDAPVDREFTLNTGVVLALFFFLVLLCAVFFGFGFSLGKKSGLATAAADTAAPAPSETAPVSVSRAKPAPGSAGGEPVPAYVSPGGSASTGESTPKPAPVKAAVSAPASTPPASTVEAPATPRSAPVVRTAPPPAPAPVQQTPMPVTPSAGTGSTYVQVAAVSHQEDADVLLSALRRRGYTVLTRSDLGDKLIHVQIGPYGNRKDAEAMRQKLIGDGYNAFLK